jgi:hypothetical protein
VLIPDKKELYEQSPIFHDLVDKGIDIGNAVAKFKQLCDQRQVCQEERELFLRYLLFAIWMLPGEFPPGTIIKPAKELMYARFEFKSTA